MLNSAIHAGQSLQVGFSPPRLSLVFEMDIPTTLLQILSETTSRSEKVRNSEYVHVENDSRQRAKQGQGAPYAGGRKETRDNAEPQTQQMQITVIVRRPGLDWKANPIVLIPILSYFYGGE